VRILRRKWWLIVNTSWQPCRRTMLVVTAAKQNLNKRCIRYVDLREIISAHFKRLTLFCCFYQNWSLAKLWLNFVAAYLSIFHCCSNLGFLLDILVLVSLIIIIIIIIILIIIIMHKFWFMWHISRKSYKVTLQLNSRVESLGPKEHRKSLDLNLERFVLHPSLVECGFYSKSL